MKSSILCAVALCLGVTAEAAAQAVPRGNAAIRFQAMDANGDRVITRGASMVRDGDAVAVAAR